MGQWQQPVEQKKKKMGGGGGGKLHSSCGTWHDLGLGALVYLLVHNEKDYHGK